MLPVQRDGYGADAYGPAGTDERVRTYGLGPTRADLGVRPYGFGPIGYGPARTGQGPVAVPFSSRVNRPP
ncbi:hypothetical protein GCM10019017_03940 [Streptomyces showdoensis]